MAESTLLTNELPNIISSIPSSAAFKYGNSDNFPINSSDPDKISIKIGLQASRILKSHPDRGFEHLPFNLARSSTIFPKTIHASPNDMFGYYLSSLLDSHPTTEIGFVVPAHWSRLQREAISQTCRTFNLPIQNIVDEATALASLYSGLKYAKIAKRQQRVLFIDIGFISFKITGFIFQNQGDHTLVNETWSDWSENLGIYHLSSKIAKNNDILIKKAHKILINNPTSALNIMEDQLQVMKSRVKSALNEYPFDEIQLIGGGAQFKFIVDLIKDAAGKITVKKEFNSHGALAQGGVMALEAASGLSQYNSFMFFPKPPHTMSIICGTSHKYCQRGAKCWDEIAEEGTKGCQVLDVLADPKTLPSGVNSILSRYRLVNLSKMDLSKKSKGIFMFYYPSPVLREIVWCNHEECKPIQTELIENSQNRTSEMTSVETILKILQIQRENEAKGRILSTLQEIFSVVGDMKAAGNMPNMTDEDNEYLSKYIQMDLDGLLTTLSKNELFLVRKNIDAIIRRSVEPNPETMTFEDVEL